jgi:hypothetical protein
MPQFLWTQKQDIGPSPRGGHALAFDPARGHIVLFGGEAAGSLFNDTWEWNGETWTQVQDTGPLARQGFAMAYHPDRQRMVLFGGASASSKLNDTWEWNGETWTQVADTGPQARSGHAMAFDSAKRRIVLFGGDSTSGLKRDTWEWDGQEWTQQQDVGPSPCVHPSMVSTGSSPIVLFGGINSIDSTAADHTVFGKTWEWDGHFWTQVQDIGPTARWLHAMAFDAVASKVVLFGGLSMFAPVNDATLLGDTWEHEIEQTIFVVSLTLDPQLLQASGEQSTATFMLSGPLTMSLQVFMAAFVDPDLTQRVSLQALDLPEDVIVGPGQTSGQFQITRGNDPLNPGLYTIAVQAGQSVQTATLQVSGEQ